MTDSLSAKHQIRWGMNCDTLKLSPLSDKVRRYELDYMYSYRVNNKFMSRFFQIVLRFRHGNHFPTALSTAALDTVPVGRLVRRKL
jgi:hypothetical protein